MAEPLTYAMPSMGADMEHGTVLRWLVQPGDTVRRGDIVAIVDTEKAEVEAEIWLDGVITELLAPVGEQLPVGAPLALLHPLGSPATATPDTADSPATRNTAERPPPTYSPIIRHQAELLGLDLHAIHGSGPGGSVTRRDLTPVRPPAPARTLASPMARRLAAAAGIELSKIPGSGPDGAVLAADLTGGLAPEMVTEQAPPPDGSPPLPRPAAARAAPRPGREAAATEPADRQARIRQATGELMARSKREIPHYYLSLDVDLGPALAWLAETNLDRPPATRLLPAALLLHATARAAVENPNLNGHWSEDRYHPADGVDLGVAVALRGGGLMAPVLDDAHLGDVEAFMGRLRALVGRARSNALRSSDLRPPSLTVTNLGDQGVDALWPVIYPPQVAMVGFGRIRERPWAIDGMLCVRPVVSITLAADHRASDGHAGARFLSGIARLLGRPPAEDPTAPLRHSTRTRMTT